MVSITRQWNSQQIMKRTLERGEEKEEEDEKKNLSLNRTQCDYYCYDYVMIFYILFIFFLTPAVSSKRFKRIVCA